MGNRNILSVVAIASAAVLSLALPTQAKNDRFDDPSGTSVYDQTLNDLMTQSIVRDLASVRAECMAGSPVYRLDCIRQGLELTSRRAPYHGDYGPMREALRAGAAAVAPIIDADADTDRDRLEVDPGTNPRFKARRYYTPTKAGSYDATKADAFKALDATQQRLLEIGKRSPDWYRAYTTVSIAVASLADVLRK
ncbi:hypothetical protein [Neorhizobium sp. NCHU2750]|uniref:hypothetical protein n=1 Tax=Neorhizobium sp. NCHU2750 TaxID=1825976 RepID=UPI000E70BDBD|nr:hypothetical protein NCHU2750_09680 [Neorhizobium sp. NCHU2750]